MSVRWLGVLCLGCLISLQWSCSVAVEVRAQEEITFTIDLDKLLASNKLNKTKLFPEGKLPHDFKIKLPFWHNINYDLSTNDDLKKYKSKIRGLRLQQLSYKVTENTLSVDLPSHKQVLGVYLAKHGKKMLKDFTKIGFFYPIPSNRINISDRLQLEDKGADIAGGFFKDLSFAIGLQGVLALDGAQNQTVPSGRIVLKVVVDVIFTVDVDL